MTDMEKNINIIEKQIKTIEDTISDPNSFFALGQTKIDVLRFLFETYSKDTLNSLESAKNNYLLACVFALDNYYGRDEKHINDIREVLKSLNSAVDSILFGNNPDFEVERYNSINLNSIELIEKEIPWILDKALRAGDLQRDEIKRFFLEQTETEYQYYRDAKIMESFALRCLAFSRSLELCSDMINRSNAASHNESCEINVPLINKFDGLRQVSSSIKNLFGRYDALFRNHHEMNSIEWVSPAEYIIPAIKDRIDETHLPLENESDIARYYMVIKIMLMDLAEEAKNIEIEHARLIQKLREIDNKDTKNRFDHAIEAFEESLTISAQIEKTIHSGLSTGKVDFSALGEKALFFCPMQIAKLLFYESLIPQIDNLFGLIFAPEEKKDSDFDRSVESIIPEIYSSSEDSSWTIRIYMPDDSNIRSNAEIQQADKIYRGHLIHYGQLEKNQKMIDQFGTHAFEPLYEPFFTVYFSHDQKNNTYTVIRLEEKTGFLLPAPGTKFIKVS